MMSSGISGDALFEAYVELILNQYHELDKATAAYWRENPLTQAQVHTEKAPLPREVWMSSQLPWIEPALITNLEERFGDDPRYWQLVFWNESNWSDGPTYSYSPFRSGPYYHLLTGMQHCTPDAGMLLMFLPAYRIAADDYVENECAMLCGRMEFSDPDREQQAKEITKAEVEVLNVKARKLIEDIGMTEEELLTKAIDADPDASDAWYRRGFYRVKSGSIREGLADLQQGNSAARNVKLIGFPLDKVQPGQIQADSEQLRVISGMFSIISICKFVESAEMHIYKVDDFFAAFSDDVERMQFAAAWITMIIRHALALYTSAFGLLIPLTVAMKQFDRIFSWMQSRVSSRELQVARAIATQVRCDCIAHVKIQQADSQFEIGSMESTKDESRDQLSDEQMKAQKDEHYLHWYEHSRNEHQIATDSLVPELKKLLTIDLPAMLRV